MSGEEVRPPATPPERSKLKKRLREIDDELRVRAQAGINARSHVGEALNSIATRDLEEEAQGIRSRLDIDGLPAQARARSERPIAALRVLRWVGLALALIGVAYGIYALATQTPLWGALGSIVSGAIIILAARDVLRRNGNGQ